MSENVDIILRLRGEREFVSGTTKSTAGVDELGRATKTAGNEAATATGKSHKFAGALHAIGRAARIGASIGIGALAAETIKATKGWADHLVITRRTGAVIKSTGGAAKVTARHVGALSDRIERQTGVDGDLVQGGANLLLTFTNIRNGVGKSNQIFDRATSTVTSMSKALGQDTKSSAIQLGKALNDPVKGITALSRVGVSFTADQKKQITALVASGKSMKAQKIILRELGREFPKVKPTPIEALQVEVRKLEDALGRQLLPVFNSGVRILTRFLNQMNAGKGAGGQFAKFLGQVGDRAKEAWPQIRDFVRNIDFGKIKQSADDLRGPLGFVWRIVKKLAGNEAVQKLALSLVAAGAAFKLVNKASGGAATSMFKFSIAGLQTFSAVTGLVSNIVAYRTAQLTANGATNAGTLATMRNRAATIASSIATKASAVATWALTMATRALNIAMRLNPIGLIITGLVLLGIGLVLAYKKFGWFRKAVNWAWDAVKQLAGFLARQAVAAFKILWNVIKNMPLIWLIRNFGKVIDAVRSLPGRISRAASGMWDGIKHAFRSAINWIIGAWNRLEFRIPKIKIPGAPDIPGFGVGTPNIPLLAGGGRIRQAGAAVVGERGPEIVRLPRAAEVIPNGALSNAAAGGGHTITTQVFLDRRQIAEAVGSYASDRIARR